MGNEVKIVITGEDKSNAALASSRKNVDGLSDSLKRMGETAGGINLAQQFEGMADSAKQFLSSTTTAASGLEQSMGAVDSVFKGSAAQIHAWGSESADSVGLSERAFNESATSIGSLLNNLGFDMEQTTDKTGELTTRAADMAAMFGGDTSEAIEAIGSALRGESDPIERYGVMLNEATVNARALADTGKSTADSLTMQEKAAARLALIMEQTSDAQGTFAKEADTVAGSQQRMTAAIEDAQAQLGSMFAPVVKVAADAVTHLVGVFENLPGPMKFVVGTLAVFIAAAVAVAPAVTAAATAMGAMGISAATLGTTLRTAAAFMTGPWGVAIAGSIGLAALWADGQRTAADATAGFSFELDQQTGKLTQAGGQALAKYLDGLKAGANGESDMSEAAEALGLSLGDLVGYLDGNEGAQRKVNRALDEGTEKGGIYRVKSSELREVLEQLGVQLDDQQRAVLEGAAATEDATDATTEHQRAVEDLHNAMMEFVDSSLAYRNAVADEVAAHEEAAAAISEHGAQSEEAAQATRDWESAIIGAVEAAGEYAASLYTGTDETERNRIAMNAANAEAARLAQIYGEDAPLALKQIIGSMDSATLQAYGMTAGVNAAGEAVIQLPNGKTVTLQGVDLVTGVVADARRAAQSIDGMTVKIYLDAVARGNAWAQANQFRSPGGQAHGGITPVFWAAQSGGQRHSSTFVNEAGPELIELPNGSNVMTAGATRALAEGGAFSGGGPAAVSVALVTDPGADHGAGQWIQSLIRKGILNLKVVNGKVVVG